MYNYFSQKDVQTFTSTAISSRNTGGYWPQSAYYCPISDAANIQARLNTYGSIRLDPANYGASGPAVLTLSSNQHIYGLENVNGLSTFLPPINITAGSTGIVVSGIGGFTGNQYITFLPGSPINNCLFKKMQFLNFVSNGASVDGNMFLDMSYCTWAIDNSSGVGYFSNNRIIRTMAQNATAEIVIKGNPNNKNTGNVWIFKNFLTSGDGGIGTPNCYMDNANEITMIGQDVEVPSTTNGYVMEFPNTVNSVRILANAGNQQVGNRFYTNSNKWLCANTNVQSVKDTVFGPNCLIGATIQNDNQNTNVDSASGSFGWDRWSIYDAQIGSEDQVLPKRNAATVSSTVPASAALDAQSIFYPTRTDSQWELPSWNNTPSNPAGPNYTAPILAGQYVDSTAYIQNLINTTGMAVLNQGIYYISSSLQIANGQALIGAGNHRTAIVAISGSIDMITCATSAGFTMAFTLADLTLQGGNTGIYLFGGIGAQQFTNWTVSSVTFRDMTTAGIYQNRIYGLDNNMIDNCDFVNCGIGFHQYSQTGDSSFGYIDKLLMMHCRFINNSNGGVYLQPTRANNLNVYVDCLFADNGTYAFSSSFVNNLIFANCVFRNNAGNGVLSATAAGPTTVVGCYFQADTQGQSMLSLTGTLNYIADCTFNLGSSTNATMFTNSQSYQNVVISNCNSVNMSGGPGNWTKYVTCINSNFGAGDLPNLSVKMAATSNYVVTPMVTGAASPIPQFLRGKTFSTLLENASHGDLESSDQQVAFAPYTASSGGSTTISKNNIAYATAANTLGGSSLFTYTNTGTNTGFITLGNTTPSTNVGSGSVMISGGLAVNGNISTNGIIRAYNAALATSNICLQVDSSGSSFVEITHTSHPNWYAGDVPGSGPDGYYHIGTAAYGDAVQIGYEGLFRCNFNIEIFAGQGISVQNNPVALTTAGQTFLTVGGTTPLVGTTGNITNGAGTNTVSITNAPISGAPTKWFPINDNCKPPDMFHPGNI